MSVEDGHWVLLLQSGGERRLLRVRRGGKTSIGKHNVLVDPIIGRPYGSNYSVEPSGLVHDPRTAEEISGSIGDVVNAQPGASNAELNDKPVGDEAHAQSLDDQDIKRLKAQGTHGADLVRAIAAGSATFSGKTAFAQEKYLRKKARKHMPHLTVLRPTPLTICDMYMLKSPDKLLWLRRDSLALLMTACNAQPGSRVLVLESTNGILAAAAVQRLGGIGRVLAASVSKPANDCVTYLNLPAEQVALGFTSLIVATKESPAPALLQLLSRLQPGSPFALYHPSIQPLAECQYIANGAQIAVRMQLLESWARPYQVAPNRTHPEMNAYPPTGYVLTGVTVLPPAQPAALQG